MIQKLFLYEQKIPVTVYYKDLSACRGETIRTSDHTPPRGYCGYILIYIINYFNHILLIIRKLTFIKFDLF